MTAGIDITCRICYNKTVAERIPYIDVRPALRTVQTARISCVRLERLHHAAEPRRRVRIAAVERIHQPVGDHAAVFVIGPRQHDDILRRTAPRHDVALAQIDADQLLL